MTVLLTRPEPDSRELARELAMFGLRSLLWPLTRIEPVPGAVTLPNGADGLLFTSANAVRVFAAKNADRDLPALCVGARTAALAREAGFLDTRSGAGDAAALARLAARSGLRRLFHPRGRDAAADMAERLAGEEIELYQQVIYAAEPTGPPPPPVAAALASGEIRVLTLWSARNARIFRDFWLAAPLVELARVTAVAISDTAAGPLEGLGFGAVLIAERPDRTAMIRAVRQADPALRR